ncbi:hypothetical protein PXH69_30580 [Rhodococcus qingshengii]|uniref:Uncharacterized protein n=1 Tax=Rhodococcus qingshengii TaxID=334542 RepID=A0AAW6LVQ1_RHOSG|nr:hypothetical protein [Rhodococcus qingshengii]MDE8649326.1 hypothetical protein [Rhodococcus qingshengii]
MQTPPPVEPLDYETWDSSLDCADGCDPAEVPRVLLWEHHDRMSTETLRRAIHSIWVHYARGGLLDLPGIRKVAAERPQRLTPAEWKTLFTRAGGYFVIEDNCARHGYSGPECPRPTTLYRFAEDGSQIGWSWSATRANAEYFETGYSHERRHGRLWRVDNVDPARLLAHFHTETKAGNPTNPQFIDEFVYEPHPDEIVEAN